MPFEAIYSNKKRKMLEKQEVERLKGIFEDADEKSLKLVDKLIRNAAFTAVMLEETSLIIARDGVIDEYQNGENQKGLKKSSAVEVYDKFLNTYSKIIKQLCDMLMDVQAAKGAAAGILDDIKNRGVLL